MTTAPLLAEAIARIASEESVSQLFPPERDIATNAGRRDGTIKVSDPNTHTTNSHETQTRAGRTASATGKRS